MGSVARLCSVSRSRLRLLLQWSHAPWVSQVSLFPFSFCGKSGWAINGTVLFFKHSISLQLLQNKILKYWQMELKYPSKYNHHICSTSNYSFSEKIFKKVTFKDWRDNRNKDSNSTQLNTSLFEWLITLLNKSLSFILENYH